MAISSAATTPTATPAIRRPLFGGRLPKKRRRMAPTSSLAHAVLRGVFLDDHDRSPFGAARLAASGRRLGGPLQSLSNANPGPLKDAYSPGRAASSAQARMLLGPLTSIPQP